MTGLIFILVVAIFVVFFLPERKTDDVEEIPEKLSQQLDKLWEIAQESIKTDKTLRAEKALLTILRFDEKNAAAYNRLGILYAKQRQFKEAIECFEIAQSLDANASSLHNVGLIYLETGNYEKAAQAFEQALSLEADLPNRYVAYAKAQEKLGNKKKAIEALESAFELERSPQILRQMAGIYMNDGDEEGVEEVKKRLIKLLAPQRKKMLKLPQRKKKLVM